MPEIKEITSLQTFSVRHPVLRPGRAIEDCRFEGDDLETTKHFGLFNDVDLIGVISLFENNKVEFNKKKQFQIRGMAIIETEQKKGFGKLLIHHIESYLYQKKEIFIWFNARINAIAFYKKMGFECYGELFEIHEVGLHSLMYKNQVEKS